MIFLYTLSSSILCLQQTMFICISHHPSTASVCISIFLENIRLLYLKHVSLVMWINETIQAKPTVVAFNLYSLA